MEMNKMDGQGDTALAPWQFDPDALAALAGEDKANDRRFLDALYMAFGMEMQKLKTRLYSGQDQTTQQMVAALEIDEDSRVQAAKNAMAIALDWYGTLSASEVNESVEAGVTE